MTPATFGLGNTNTAVSALVRQVNFRSQISPDLPWSPTTGTTGSSSGLSNAVMSFIKPSVEVTLAGGNVVRVAPWGEPTGNYFPALVAITALVGVGVAAGLIMTGRWLAK